MTVWELVRELSKLPPDHVVSVQRERQRRRMRPLSVIREDLSHRNGEKVVTIFCDWTPTKSEGG